MTIIAKQVRITGKVQGVFYRNWTATTARSLGLNGWVRNRLDGSVEAHIQGEPDAVARFLELARSGPPAARVTDVVGKETDVGAFDGFSQAATA